MKKLGFLFAFLVVGFTVFAKQELVIVVQDNLKSTISDGAVALSYDGDTGPVKVVLYYDKNFTINFVEIMKARKNDSKMVYSSYYITELPDGNLKARTLYNKETIFNGHLNVSYPMDVRTWTNSNFTEEFVQENETLIPELIDMLLNLAR
jgi:hypothetical protein